MKKVFENKIVRYVALALAFLFTSLCTYYGYYTMVPIITHYGRGLLTYFPTLLCMWMPSMIFCFGWMIAINKNPSSKWKIARLGGLIVTAEAGICLITHILMIILEFKGKAGASISPLFPYDVLALLTLLTALGISTLVWCKKNASMREENNNDGQIIKRRTIVAGWFYLVLTSYFTGCGMSFVFYLVPVDHNLLLMIPFFISFFLPLLGLVCFDVYKHGKEEKKQDIYKTGLITLGVATAVIYALVIVCVIVNPYILQDSLSGMYILGFAIKIPFALFVIAAGMIALWIVAFIRYLKTYKKQ